MALRRKTATEVATEVTVEAPASAPLCGSRGDNIRANCSLPKGHVLTSDDWHEADARSNAHVKTNRFEHSTTTSEHFRWAPNEFEVPREARTTEP